MATTDRDYLVTVCAECLMACCWHGEYMCEKSKTANVTKVPVSRLRELNREHPSHYSPERLLAVTGELP